MTRFIRFIPFLLFLALGLFLLKGLSLDAHDIPSVKVGQLLPEFTSPSLEDGTLQSSDQLRGQMVVLNVWASWCAVCIEEQDFLFDLVKQGIPVYGLNYKDEPDAAKQWLARWGNPYVWSISDQKGYIALDLGVYGAPETFLIDKNGVIRYRHAGALTPAIWQRMQESLI